MIVESQTKPSYKGLSISKEYVKTLPVGTPLKGTYKDGSGFLFKYVCISKTTGDICWTTACVAFDKDNHIDIETSFLGYKTGEVYRLTRFENLIVKRMTNEELEKYHDAIHTGRIEHLSASDAEHNRIDVLKEADIPFAKLEKSDEIKVEPRVVMADDSKNFSNVDDFLKPKFYTKEEERKYFKPFCTKVLVSNGHDKWIPAIFGCFTFDKPVGGNMMYTVVGGNVYKYCIPWKLNKQLLGMTYFKF